MSIETDVVAVLTAGTPPSWEVYPQAAPQDAEKPFVIYRVATEPVTTIHGTVVINRHTFTFECWGATASAARTAAAELRALIDASSLTKQRTTAPDNDYNAETDEYVEPVVYDFWKT